MMKVQNTVESENIDNIYTKANIISLIENFENIYSINFSEEVFHDLESKTHDYQDFVLQISNCISKYNEWKSDEDTFSYNDEPIVNIIDITERIKLESEMKQFIENWSVEPNIQNQRIWFKQRVKKIIKNII
mgnify:CR=1 FL=1